ncbi:MAG: NAD(P)-binding domain-containing protein [Candidatus Thermoplasmatota archaeon]|nr:NAD(P)-binding domain-containing protein [Candidatus Thermoplasmatota archaeon]
MIAVIGLGKAGLPLAAVAADSGFDVIGIDTDENRCKMINSGKNPIPEEKGLSELIKRHCRKKFIATSRYKDAKDCDVLIITVPLYVTETFEADFSLLESAFRNIGKILKKGAMVILETTVPPTTTETLGKKWLEEESRLSLENGEFYLAYSPERIMTGYSISRLKEFPKVIGGVNNESGAKALEFYKKSFQTCI